MRIIVLQRWRHLALTVAVLGAAACSGSAQRSAADVEADSATPTVVEVAPTATPLPVVEPTPTPLPTPTPPPKPAIPTGLLLRSIDENFVALDELGLDYSFAVFVEGFGFIERRNAQTRLLPASNQKLVTAVGALELLRPEFRFVTEVRLDDAANVYVVGGGDPTLTSAHIETFAEDLIDELTTDVEDEAVSIRDLIIDPSYFPPTRTGPGWLDRYVPVDAGPMSGLMIDDNQHRGDEAYVADPDQGNADLIAEIFARAGIEITGEVLVGAADLDAPLVLRRASPPLETMIDTILGRSDNEIANALLRQIGLELGGEGEIPVGQALIFEAVAELGVDLGEAAGDGSGLSRDNRLSAQAIVELLLVSQSQPWWPIVDRGLAGAGGEGTLAARLGGDTTRGNVRAKTGSLDDVRALSGILTTIDGSTVFFSFLVNGEEAAEGVKAMDQIIVAYASATLPQLTR